MDEARPLWTCPECGQSFVARNMAHSCFRQSEEAFFAGREAQRELYHAFLEAAQRGGPVVVNINKTRISFQARARFASVNRVLRDGLACHLWLKRRIDSPRFTRVEHLPPSDHIHHFKLTDASQLDAEMAGWLAEAHEVGMQRRVPGNDSRGRG